MKRPRRKTTPNDEAAKLAFKLEEALSRIGTLERKLEERERDLSSLSGSSFILEKRFDSFVEISRKIASSRDLDEVLLGIMQAVDGMMKVEASSLLLLDEKSENLVFRVTTGKKSEEIKRFVLKMGEGIAGSVAKDRKPTIVNNASQDDRHLHYIGRELGYETRNILCVPLTVSDRLIGVMEAINRTDGGPFTESDALLLSTIANQSAILIDHARLFKELQEKVSELTTLIEVSSLVNSTLDLNPLLNLVMELSTKVMKAEASSLLLLDESGKELVFKITQGEKGEIIREVRIPVGKGIAGWVAQRREPINVPDVSVDSRFYRGIDEATGFITKSVLCVPVETKGKLLGVVEVLNKTQGGPAFSEDDLKLFVALAGQSAIAIDNAGLFSSLERSHAELALAYDSTIEGWSKALELRDKETEGHTLRVAEMTLNLARAMGMNEAELVHIRRGALLHDIGKMGVPDSILLKSGPLTDEEWRIMRRHPAYAYEMLSPIAYLRPALDIPYCHHEKWDGTGYPRGLRGEAIPLAARIFAAVDVWDALRSDRPYRSALPVEKVREHIESLSGTHLDPKVVKVFLGPVPSGLSSQGEA
jgi:putative nucleotidyltransferase with HDIG domain